MTKSLPPKSLVLYADDDPDDIELIREAFHDFSGSIELITFQSGRDLIDYIEALTPLQPSPCLLVIDINMPGVNGKETLTRLRTIESCQRIPAVLFSTSTMPADAAFARSLGAGFVTKPLLSNQIRLIVDQLIEHCTDEVKERINRHRRNK